MARLFIALTPPRRMRDILQKTMHGIVGARWQSDVQLHLTLCFLGDVSDADTESIADRLALVSGKPVAVALSGVGSFMRKGRPHTLWAGVTPPDGVTALAARLRWTVAPIRPLPDRGMFKPHVTLARLNGSCGPVDGWLAANSALSSDTERFNQFGLYESLLRPEGADYRLLQAYRLT